MMSKEPPIPHEKNETIRQKIISALSHHTLSACEISAHVRIAEKDVYEHLDHIRRSIDKKEQILSITPAECKKCGFLFRKRERLKKPSRCPSCRSEFIQEPLFSIRGRRDRKK